MKTRTIRQTVTFEATPHEVYEALMDSKKHASFAGGKCVVSRKVGGRVSVSDGYITGKNLELVPDKRIVQAWRPEEECWPSDHWSTVSFSLRPLKNGTKLTFVHTGVPVECGDRFDSGWRDYYWEPMKAMFAED